MNARLGFGFVYGTITRGLDEDRRLQIDALLGDVDAEVEMQERRREAFAAMGAEVG